MVLAASFGNVTYLGLPVITEMLGTGMVTWRSLRSARVDTAAADAGVFFTARHGDIHGFG
jgi:predicted permease